MTAPEPSGLTTIECIYFETPPYDHTLTPDGGVDEVAEKYASLPTPFLEMLDAVLRNADASRCAGCDGAVGFVLGENSDGVETLEWIDTSLARKPGGQVMLLCATCAPGLPL